MNEYGHQTNYVTPTAREPVDTVTIPDDETEEETQHGAPDAKPATPLETSETQPQLAGPSSTHSSTQQQRILQPTVQPGERTS